MTGVPVPGTLTRRLLHPRGEEEVLELALAHQVLLDLALLDLEQRRLGDEEMPGLDHRTMWRKKKVRSSVRMCAPSTSASVIRMILW